MVEQRWARAEESGVFTPLMDEEEIKFLEDRHPDGMTAQEVVELFSSRGVRLSEATFRKYVQLGLLPRSRRVRRQGRRGGSLGLYPATVMRRIVEIKRLLAEDFTMDEIRRKFLCATSEIDELEESLTRVFERLNKTVDDLRAAGYEVGLVQRELVQARRSANQLAQALRQAERRLEMQARNKIDQRMVV
jgi:hypothetical protein